MCDLNVKYGIEPELMAEVFPFHFVFDKQLQVVQIGPALKKLLPELQFGGTANSFAKILTPAKIAFDFESISEQLFTIYFIQLIASKITLKGQMLRVKGNGQEHMLFLCSPVVREMDAVAQMGLSLNDFAIHDSAVDFLILLQTKNNTINDVKKMASRLKTEVAVRRQAEKDLQQVNSELEHRVIERTKELTFSNQALNKEVAERKRAQSELQQSVETLEIRNHQITVLNKMGDMLQACRSVAETYQVIIDSIQQLFPNHSGALSLYDEQLDKYCFVAEFGGNSFIGLSFKKEECWSLRRGRMHVAKQLNEKSICEHFTSEPENGYICVPLTVSDEQLGMLHIYSGIAAQSSVKHARFQEIEQLQQVLLTASEHIALAIANLKLRESLWLQSVRDKLTGLFNRRYMEETLEREVLKAHRYGKSVAIIMTDVDHFKHFNDTYGHQAGDVLLENLGALLKTFIRGEDVACRYGGEEFILVMPDAVIEVAEKRAELIRQTVENDFTVEFDGSPLPQVTLSLGVSVFERHGNNVKELVQAADAALYKAKREGRNCVKIAH